MARVRWRVVAMLCQRDNWAQAARSTQWPSGTIKPVRSAMGMKRAGETAPRTYTPVEVRFPDPPPRALTCPWETVVEAARRALLSQG